MKIYKIINKVNGKIYIGKTTKELEKRLETHIKNATVAKRRSRLYSAIRKYGTEAFLIELVYELKDDERTECNLNRLEREFIKTFCSKDPQKGYNMTDGGDGGKNEKSMAASSRLRKGKTFEDLYGFEKAKTIAKKISESIKDFYSKNQRVIPQKVRDKICDTLKNKYKNDKEFRNNVLKAIKNIPKRKIGEFSHSENTKKKMSDFRMGKTFEQLYGETKAKELIEKQSKKWMKNGNPNYVDFPILKKIEVIDMLILHPEKIISEISKMVGYSEFKIRSMFKKLGVDNIQKMRYSRPHNEVVIFLESLKNKCKEIN